MTGGQSGGWDNYGYDKTSRDVMDEEVQVGTGRK